MSRPDRFHMTPPFGLKFKSSESGHKRQFRRLKSHRPIRLNQPTLLRLRPKALHHLLPRHHCPIRNNSLPHPPPRRTHRCPRRRPHPPNPPHHPPTLLGSHVHPLIINAFLQGFSVNIFHVLVPSALAAQARAVAELCWNSCNLSPNSLKHLNLTSCTHRIPVVMSLT
jgi:hypothetical protein